MCLWQSVGRSGVSDRDGLLHLLELVLVTRQVQLPAGFDQDIDQVGPWGDLDLGSPEIGRNDLDMGRHVAKQLLSSAGGDEGGIRPLGSTRRRVRMLGALWSVRLS